MISQVAVCVRFRPSSSGRCCLLIELPFKHTDNTEDFVERGHFSEEHFTSHFLIVFAPRIDVLGGRQEPECAGMNRGVIHP